jgi:hypothetical protein
MEVGIVTTESANAAPQLTSAAFGRPGTNLALAIAGRERYVESLLGRLHDLPVSELSLVALGSEHRCRGPSPRQSDALGDGRRGGPGGHKAEGELVVQLVLGAPAPIAAGRGLHGCLRVPIDTTCGVHQTAAAAGLRVFVQALGALQVADVMVGLITNGE